ncbi:MFS transporter [Marivibrio halodurans]|uniref:MFS transporter n=1 Tax=Marivibrio halodurans TaxID=2039722 RepID=A0A8J7SNS6_9PROT|nr:MFS transporter [Marivibrio halodurans]MBP5857856.1 MFS transporter [Marivibrio halodurans]
MISVLVGFGALFVSLAILSLGNGLLPTLIAVRAAIEGFSAVELGLIAAAYFASFGIGCLAAVPLVRRVGHIRSFAVMAAVVASAATAHALSVDPWSWIVFRAVAGLGFAGLYVVIESWVNELSTNENRGRVLSVYRIVDLAAMTGGQYLLPLADPAGFELFSVVTILIALSLVPVGLTKGVQPGPVAASRVRILHFFKASPLAMVGCVVVGVTLGTFWGLAGKVAVDAGLDSTGVATFMASAIVGGAVLQLPVGRLSDFFDRRLVLTVASALAGVSGLVLAAVLILGATDWMLFAAVGFFGGLSMPIYSLCVAHMNDHLSAGDFVEAGAALLVAYAVGAVAGPVAAGALLPRFGPASLFIFTAAAHGLLVLYALYRMTRRAPVPAEEQADFVATERTTPQVFVLDPRSEADLDQPAEEDRGDDDDTVAPASPDDASPPDAP